MIKRGRSFRRAVFRGWPRPALGVVLCAGAAAAVFAGDPDTVPQAPPFVPVVLRELLPARDDEAAFRPLFLSDDRVGWVQCGPGEFTLTNGVARAVGGMGLWWCAERTYTNFILRGEWKMEAADSDTGVFVRFADPGSDPWNAVRTGHELEIGDDPEGKDPVWRTGALYPFSPPARVPIRPIGEWNRFEFVAIGQTYIVRINGEIVNVWTDPDRRTVSGHIGLQNYAEGKGAQFRQLRIRELP